MKGVDQFEQWLPDVLIGMLQQGADVPAGDVARAVGLAVATTGFIVVVRLGLRVLGALKNLFAGHQMVERAPGGLAILRKLSGFAAFALPWYNLIHLASDGELTAEMANFTILVATAWLALIAASRDRTWVDLAEGVVRGQRGLFRRSTLTLQLPLVVVDDRGVAVGSVERLSGRRLSVTDAAVEALAPYRGGTEPARTYLNAAVVAAGGQLAR